MNTSLFAPSGALGVTAPSVVLAATFTADPLIAPLGYFLREVGLPLGTNVAPYGQIFQQLLDPTSQFLGNRGGVNVVLLRFEDWLRDEGGRLTWSAGQGQKLERNADDLVAALREASLASVVPIVVAICPPSAEAAGCAELIAVGDRFRAALDAVTGLRFLPMQWCEDWSAAEIHDFEGDRLGQVPYTRRFFLALGREITRLAHALKNPPAKVIVLDCDNTLWDGVVGEDGASGIKLTSRHRDLQSFVLAKKQAGMLLCLASKNVESDVLEVFEQRKDMVLRAEDIVAMRVNWLPKSENIHALASELNLGLDSFIFIDDNPIECAEVEAACPGVLVVCLPPSEEPRRILGNLWPLDVLDITDEDRRRSDMVRQNLARDRFAKSTDDLASFLAGLELQVTCSVPTAEHRARVSQLTLRTNQFNFTTKRRSEAEIDQLVSKGFECRGIEVRDRFGDYGLVGVMLFSSAAEALVVDTFLLSCRVLGRGVEHAMLRALGALAKERGLARVELPFIATKKNQPARRFLDSLPAEMREADGMLVVAVAAERAAALVYAPGCDSVEAPLDGAATESSVVLPAVVNSSRSERWSRLVRTIDHDDDLLVHLAQEARGSRQTSKPVATPRTETERTLVAIWSDVLGVAEVGIEDDYVNDLGGTSLLAVSVFARIARELGVRLPLATLVEAPTIAALGGRIDQPVDQQSLVLLNGGGKGTPLFLVHDADGETLLYRNLAQRLGDRPVYGVQPHARAGSPIVHTRIPEMAAHYLAEIRKLYPRGPYLLGGLCAGGIIASEMALQLEDVGETARLVAVFDAAAVETPRKPHLEDGRRLERVRQAWGELSLVQASRAIAAKVGGYVSYQVQSTCTHLLHRAAVEGLRYCWDHGATPPRWLHPPDVRSVYAIAEAEYRPGRALRDKIVLFRASEGEGADEPYLRFYDDPLLGWGKHSQTGVRSFDVPGGHGSMLQEPHVATIADILRPILAEPTVARATIVVPGGRAA
jgi:FkbH-like protein